MLVQEDPEFPADTSSLFLDETNPMHDASVVHSWRRPNEISSAAALFIDGSSDSDVMQGALGDCWFIAALCVVADRPDLMRELFVSCHPELGFYQVRFWKQNQWVVVTIDDRIPCTSAGIPSYGRCRNDAEMWVPILEKAYAKLHGCYEALNGGNVAYAFVDLTAGAADDVYLDGPVQSEAVWKQLSNYMEEHWLVAASIVKGGGIEEKHSCGLLERHAYGITRVADVQQAKLVQIRNPWGQTEWNGKWSDSDTIWKTSELSTKLNYQTGDDGLFWMSLDDFVKYYNRIYVCRLYQDDIGAKWIRTAVEGEWKGITAGGCLNNNSWMYNPQYVLRPTTRTQLFSTLVQNDSRLTGLPTVSIGLMLLRTDDPYKRKISITTADVVATCKFTDSRDVSLGAILEANQNYIIIPTTFKPMQEGRFLLALFTDKTCLIQSIASAGDITQLQDCDVNMKAKGSGLSTADLASLGIVDASKNRSQKKKYQPKKPRSETGVLHKFASIIGQAIDRHRRSGTSSSSIDKDDQLPDFILTHPGYNMLSTLSSSDLQRLKLTHPALSPLVEHIEKSRANSSSTYNPVPSSSANSLAALGVTLPNGDFYQGGTKNGLKHGRGVYKYKNGDWYEGEFQDGDPHGTGKFVFANGTTYEGQLVRGKFEGKGRFTFASGAVYEGDFKDDKFNGKGRTILPDGHRHEGGYKDDKFHGPGTYSYKNGDVLTGIYESGHINEGELAYSNGDRYNGSFKNDKPSSTSATLTYATGSVYRGAFKKGLSHGIGQMTFPNGDVYFGEWSRGIRQGKGTYKRPSGDYYEGTYVNGQREGHGKLVEEGDTYEGEFRRGQPHGRGSYLYANGARYEGEMEDGHPSGEGRLWLADGSVYTGGFKNGLRHGRGVQMRPNGATYQGEYAEGEMSGFGRYTYPNGDVYEGHFAKNKFNGHGHYSFASGDPPLEGLFRDGKPVSSLEKPLLPPV